MRPGQEILPSAALEPALAGHGPVLFTTLELEADVAAKQGAHAGQAAHSARVPAVGTRTRGATPQPTMEDSISVSAVLSAAGAVAEPDA